MIGIKKLNVYIPSEIVPAKDEKGFVYKRPIARGLSHIELLKRAISNDFLSENDVMTLAVGGSGLYDYKFWSPSAKLSQYFNEPPQHAFELTQGCNSHNVLLKLLVKNNEKSLIVLGDKLSDVVDQYRSDHFSIVNFSDASACILLDKNPILKPLNFKIITDPQFSDYLYIPINKYKVEYTQDRELHKDNLKECYLNNYLYIIRELLKESGIDKKKLKKIYINQGDWQIFNKLAKILNLSKNVFFKSYKKGHMGCVDTLYGLQQDLNENKLKSKDIILIVSSAIGFSWGGSLWQMQ